MPSKHSKVVPDEVKTIPKFPIKNIPQSSTIIVIGKPGTGKSNLIKHIMYLLRGRYPVCRVWNGTEESTGFYGKFVPDLYISNDYSETEHKSSTIRNRKINEQIKRGKKSGNLVPDKIEVVDDVSDNKKIIHNNLMRSIFKMGARHWNQLFIYGTQFMMDFPNDVRNSAGIVFLFGDVEIGSRKKLYENFGGVFGSFDKFCAYFDEITNGQDGKYRTMVLVRHGAKSTSLEDMVFWHKAPNMENTQFTFGCKQFVDHSQKRFDPDYEEDYGLEIE
jgi:energy-coupling factor transporter ATP-binding protein EcfA2